MPSREPRIWPRRWATRSDLIPSLGLESRAQVGLWVGGEGPRVRSYPEPFLVSRSCPSHPQTPAVSLSPRERCKGLGENSAVQRVAEFLRTFLMVIKTPSMASTH